MFNFKNIKLTILVTSVTIFNSAYAQFDMFSERDKSRLSDFLEGRDFSESKRKNLAQIGGITGDLNQVSDLDIELAFTKTIKGCDLPTNLGVKDFRYDKKKDPRVLEKELECLNSYDAIKHLHYTSKKREYHIHLLLEQEAMKKHTKCVTDLSEHKYYSCLQAELVAKKKYADSCLGPNRTNNCFAESYNYLDTVLKSEQCSGYKRVVSPISNIFHPYRVIDIDGQLAKKVRNKTKIEDLNEVQKLAYDFHKCINTVHQDFKSNIYQGTPEDFVTDQKVKDEIIELKKLDLAEMPLREPRTEIMNCKFGGNPYFEGPSYSNSRVCSIATSRFDWPVKGLRVSQNDSFIQDMLNYNFKSSESLFNFSQNPSLSYRTSVLKSTITNNNNEFIDINAKTEPYIGIDKRLVSERRHLRYDFGKAVIPYFPEPDQNGLFQWRDKDKGHIKFAMFGPQIYEILQGLLNRNTELGVSVYFYYNFDSQSIDVLARYFLTKPLQKSFPLSQKYKQNEVIGEWQLVKKNELSNGHSVYEIKGDYKTIATYRWEQSQGIFDVVNGQNQEEAVTPVAPEEDKEVVVTEVKEQDKNVVIPEVPEETTDVVTPEETTAVVTPEVSVENNGDAVAEVTEADKVVVTPEVPDVSEESSEVVTPEVSVENDGDAVAEVTETDKVVVTPEVPEETSDVATDESSEDNSNIIRSTDEERLQNATDAEIKAFAANYVDIGHAWLHYECDSRSDGGVSLSEIAVEARSATHDMVMELARVGCSIENASGCHSSEASSILKDGWSKIEGVKSKVEDWKQSSTSKNPEICSKIYTYY